MATVNEVNNDKKKVPDEFIFILFILLARSTTKYIHVSLLITL